MQIIPMRDLKNIVEVERRCAEERMIYIVRIVYRKRNMDDILRQLDL